MFGEILDALAKPIRDGALSSLRGGPSGGLVAQLEEIVGKYDALRGQPASSAATASASSPAPAPASATGKERPKRTPLPYELEIERMCCGDVRERAARHEAGAETPRPETTERPKSEPGPRETGSIPFPNPVPGLVALLEEIDRLDTLGIFRQPFVRSKAASAESVQAEPVQAEPVQAEPATCPDHADHGLRADMVETPDEPIEREPLAIDRRRLARAQMLRRRRALAAAKYRRPKNPLADHTAPQEPPACVGTRHPIARGPP